MASEWALDGIRVNAVAPGYVMTDLVRALIDKGALNASDIEARTPMGRFARPEEIAEATLPVDGGWLAFGAPPQRLASVAERRAGL
jgi:NAD(P)-dependent dehydrogenase (short-subunit alcohol dehydrogenase family)